jgi:hypothetical protein
MRLYQLGVFMPGGVCDSKKSVITCRTLITYVFETIQSAVNLHSHIGLSILCVSKRGSL